MKGNYNLKVSFAELTVYSIEEIKVSKNTTCEAENYERREVQWLSTACTIPISCTN